MFRSQLDDYITSDGNYERCSCAISVLPSNQLPRVLKNQHVESLNLNIFSSKRYDVTSKESEGLCYEIVKEAYEKALTLEETRNLVNQHCFLNKEDLTKTFDQVFAIDLNQHYENTMTDGDSGKEWDCLSETMYSSEEPPHYAGKGYESQEETLGSDVDDDSLLDDTQTINGVINVNHIKPKLSRFPIANYGNSAVATWSNELDDSTSDEEFVNNCRYDSPK